MSRHGRLIESIPVRQSKGEYLWMALTAGERQTVLDFLCSPFSAFSLRLFLSLPRLWVSVKSPIVHDIQPQCENQQMASFVCVASDWACVFLSVYEERVGEGELRSRE